METNFEFLKKIEVQVVPKNQQCQSLKTSWMELHWIFIYCMDRPGIGFSYGKGGIIYPNDMLHVVRTPEQVEALRVFVHWGIETGDVLQFEQDLKKEFDDGITRFTAEGFWKFKEFLRHCGGFTVQADEAIESQASRLIVEEEKLSDATGYNVHGIHTQNEVRHDGDSNPRTDSTEGNGDGHETHPVAENEKDNKRADRE